MIEPNVIINDTFTATIVEFGEGDVSMLPAIIEGKHALMLQNVEKGDLGRFIPAECDINVMKPQLILTFSDPKSVDILIWNLLRMKLDIVYPKIGDIKEKP